MPAPVVTQASWAPDTLEELLAPIALYPDQLLGQILAASVNSQEVLDAGNWLLQNQSLKGDALDAAATKAGFGPSMRALVQFPTVVDMMCQQIDWTRQVGSAFTSDQKAVLDAVQSLRTQAAQAGNLKSTPEQQVETTEESGKTIVEVKPADPKVVYVPQYDPQAVYAAPSQQSAVPPPTASATTPPATTAPAPAAAPATTSTTTTQDTVSTGAAVAGGLLAFGVGVVLGKALEDDDDYCYPNWNSGVVFYGPRPFYPPAYVYRPAYGPAFRPAYHYTSPPGYRYGYNNTNARVNQNIVVNNNNYFNRFTNNQNLRVNASQETLGAAARNNTYEGRVGEGAAVGRGENWKGQSTYAGTRRAATTEGLNEAASARSGTRSAASADARREADTRRDTQAAARSQAAARNASEPRHDAEARRNTASSPALAEARALDTDRPQRVDRGYGTSSRNAEGGHAAPEHTAMTADASRDGALSGALRENSGSFDRAASARGHASADTRDARSGRRR